MLRISGFALAALGLLLVPANALAIGHAVPKQPKTSAPKVVVQPKTVIINHTPAAVGNVVKPPAVKVAVPPPASTKVVTNIHQKFPTTPIHVDQKAFVETNQHKFVGAGQKGFVVKDYARIDPPQIKYKGSHPVVQAFPEKFRPTGFKKRPDFIANYDKHWSERLDHRHERAFEIRQHLGANYFHLFTPDWWGHYRNVHLGWWGRYPVFAARWFAFPQWRWWRPAPWETVIGWCYGAPAWAPPFYYDYGGNVTYDNNVVYVEDQPVATQQDYALQAMQLAESGAALLYGTPPSPDNIEQQWLPLGSFAVANEDQGNPTQFLQLAVNKQGVIAGSFYNGATDEAQPVVGRIDPKTQRAAWYLGDTKTTVMETGAYNLTAPETQVLVHFGTTQTQTWILVRMQEPPK
jgi:hypothetical protein